MQQKNRLSAKQLVTILTTLLLFAILRLAEKAGNARLKASIQEILRMLE